MYINKLSQNSNQMKGLSKVCSSRVLPRRHSFVQRQVFTEVKLEDNRTVSTLQTSKGLEQTRELCQKLSGQPVNDYCTIIEHPKTTSPFHKVEDDQIITPLSHMQKSIWLECMKTPSSVKYILRWCYKLEGNLDTSKLEKALYAFINKHSCYRTRFGEDIHGEPYQYVENIASSETILEKIDAWKQSETKIQAIIDQEGNRGFDLYKDRLFRFYLIEAGSGIYYLLGVWHHIIFDGPSAMQWVAEVSDMYQNGVNFEQVKASASKGVHSWHQYQHQLDKNRVQESREYWREYFEGASGIDLPSLPDSHPTEEEGTEILHYLSDDLMNDIKRFNKEQGSSVFKTLLVAFQVLLHKYSGERDVALLYPTNLRPKELEDLAGHYIGLQPIRVKIDPDTTVANLIQQVTESLSAAEKHLPFDFSVPVGEFNSMFAKTVNMWDKLLNFGSDVKVTWIGVKKISCVKDFNIAYDFAGKTIGVRADFSTSKYSNSYIHQVLRHYQRILEVMVGNPTQKVADVNVISELDFQQAIHIWNKTDREYPSHLPLHAIVEEWAEKQPDSIAIKFNDEQITYKELNSKANQMAHYLIESGVEPETLVAVSLPRSIELIVAFLAILKTGAAYVPLDPDHPVDRLQYMLDDSQAAVVIARPETADKTEGENRSNSFLNQAVGYPDHNPGVQVAPNNLMKVIYTSGSTGKPKGVMIEHKGVVRLVKNTNYIKLGPGDRMCQVANTSFDASALEIWGALLNGATLVIVPTDLVLATDKFVSFLQSGIVNYMQLTTGLFDQIAAECPAAFEKIETIVIGGDKLSPIIAGKVLADKKRAPKRIVNAYGPTENSTISTAYIFSDIDPKSQSIPIGYPIANSKAYILDNSMNPVPVGVVGELYCGGDGLARGYLFRPEMTDEKFIVHTFADGTVQRLYKSGDMAKYLPDGSIDFLGRNDGQVKIRGFRIELGEIEAQIRHAPFVKDATVTVFGPQKMIVAYIVLSCEMNAEDVKIELKQTLSQSLAPYMVPSAFVVLPAIPLTVNGKVDKRALPDPVGSLSDSVVAPRNEIEQTIVDIWKQVLGLSSVSVHDNFFDIGGHSLLVARVRGMLPDSIKEKLAITDMFKYPTIDTLVQFVTGGADTSQDKGFNRTNVKNTPAVTGDIAIIGVAGRFPSADTVEEFWKNVSTGTESITFFSKEELKGIVPDELLENPQYVRAKGVIRNCENFDAEFFGFTPREAQITDPQHRIFLECVWEAIERAGYDSKTYKGRIGVYGGMGSNYYVRKIMNTDLADTIDPYSLALGNEKDFLCSRASYKLGLKGPALTVQTACSTSLVAVHQAVQSLLAGTCEIAVAGGVSLGDLDKKGYLYQEGMILSPDGHCRAFDSNAAGTIQSQGAGLVVLKPLDKAIADRDHIYSVVKCAAINNDGSDKIGFTAPSDLGQAEAILSAYETSGIDPSTVSYIEAHGTGTQMGDPIEIEGLSRVFQSKDSKIAIGSVKSNIGHLDAAAGVTGLINASLAMYNKVIPPTLHFQSPNPKLNLGRTPFYVNTEPTEWNTGTTPRRAGISAFGLGGTNAHVIIEEAPTRKPREREEKTHHILSLSAKTKEALNDYRQNLVQFLQDNPTVDLSDVAYTLHTGRRKFAHVLSVVCKDVEDAVRELSHVESERVVHVNSESQKRPVVFVFPGGGCQHVGMGSDLYQSDSFVRNELDNLFAILQNKRPDLFGVFSSVIELFGSERMHEGPYMHAVVFMIEYSLAKRLMSWGIQPSALVGHSLGEYVAATLSGVFEVEDVLELLAFRGDFVQGLPKGAMLSVRINYENAQEYIDSTMDIAVVNSPNNCVVSGTIEAIEKLEKTLAEKQIDCSRLPMASAYHSRRLEPVLEMFSEYISRLKLKPANKRMTSSVTGTWHKGEQIADPQYWTSHMRNQVKFSQCISDVLSDPALSNAVIVEVGPGKTLGSFVKHQLVGKKGFSVVNTMRHLKEKENDVSSLFNAVSKIWMEGGAVDWSEFYAPSQCYKVPLPTYPFQRKRYWIDVEQQISNKPKAIFKLENVETSSKSGEQQLVTDPIHLTIMEVWKKLLGHEEIRLDDDFFEIGGDSLVAVRFLAKVKEIFSVALPGHTVMQNRTVSRIADVIKQHMSPSEKVSTVAKHPLSEALIALQQGRSKTPIFLVHAVGGDVYGFDKLASGISSDHPVYAFRALSLDGNVDPVDCIKKMAQIYVELLETQHSEGPVIVGGWSYGGVVALEMAQILKSKNRKVPLLVVLDSPISTSCPPKLTSDEIIQYLSKYSLAAESSGESGISQSFIDTWIAHQNALHSYQPTKYHGDVLYFRAGEKQNEFMVEPITPWFDVVEGELKVHKTPGVHASMLSTPSVQVISQKLSQHLAHLCSTPQL